MSEGSEWVGFWVFWVFEDQSQRLFLCGALDFFFFRACVWKTKK